MRNKAAIACLWIAALVVGGMKIHAEKIFVCNPFDHAWSGPVNINLRKMKLSRKSCVVVKDESGKFIPSQTDDLDFDGKADETVVLISLKSFETKMLDLSFSSENDTGAPFAETLGKLGLKCDCFELEVGVDGLINSLSLLQGGGKLQVVRSSNLHVWKVDNTGWEQKSAKLTVKRKIGPLRAIYDIKGDMHGIKTKGQMTLHRQIKVYPDSRIDNSVEIAYQSGGPFFTGNREGGIRSTIECDVKKMYRTLSWDFGNKLKTADMRHAWHHMRRVPGGIVGGFMDPAKGYGVISMPDRRDSSLRLWDNRTTYIPGTPAKQMLIVNGLGWWGKTVKSGNKLKSGWQTYAFGKQEQAEKMAKTMIGEPLVFYSPKSFKKNLAKLYGIDACKVVAKTFSNAGLKTSYEKVLGEKASVQYQDAVSRMGTQLWDFLDKQCDDYLEKHDNVPVVTNAEKYLVYRKMMKQARLTSDWKRFRQFTKRAVTYILKARQFQQKIQAENIGKLVSSAPNAMNIGFFGGDPEPKAEDIWSAFSTMIGLKYFHPAYFTHILRRSKPDWAALLRLHKKYGGKYVICINMDRKGYDAREKLKDEKYREWLALNHDGKVHKGWYGKIFSAVDPELYGSTPEWMEQGRKNLQAAIKAYLEMCKKNNLKINEVIVGFAVENEPVFMYDYNPHVMKAYHNWLKKQFADIADFNRKMKSRYKNFSEVYPPSTQKRFSRPAEWINFNQFRLDNQAGYIRWQANIIKQVDPGLIVITKPNCSYGTGAAIQRGNDSWKMGWSQLGKTGMNLYCRESDFVSKSSTQLDMIRSGGNGQLMWMTEFGLAPFQGLPGSKLIPRARASEMIYSMALHGMEKIFLYQIGSARRNPTSYLKGDYFPTGSMLGMAERQTELNTLGSMNNFTPERKAAIYYSRLSSIMGKPDPLKDTVNVHEMLRHLNYQVDYVDLEQAQEGRLKEYDMLYIQRSLYIDNKLPVLLKKYVKNGGVVVMEGPSGIYDVRGGRYKAAPAGLADLFGASLMKSGGDMDLTFDDETSVNTGNGKFSIDKPDYSLKVTSGKVIMKNAGNGQPLAVTHRVGSGHAILISFPLGKNYKKVLDKSSKVTGKKQAFFDKVGGLAYNNEKAFVEPVQVPIPGKWLENALGTCGMSPAISRAEKDIEATVFHDNSGRECVILINHRNMKLSPRLILNKVRMDEPVYDIFTLDKFIPREIEGKSIIRVDMQPYQVRILARQIKQ